MQLSRRPANTWRSAKPPWKDIDKGIRKEVRILWENGVHTTESCEGSRGHPFPEPAVRFAGDMTEGFRALGIALFHRLPVSDLRRVWHIQDGEPVGPEWEITFHHSDHGLHAVIGHNGICRHFEWR